MQEQVTYPGLPELCYSKVGESDECVILKRGVSGYYPTGYGPGYTDQLVDELNQRLGVSPAQRLAMEIGSMAGWTVPGADPEIHVKRMIELGRMAA